MCLVVDYSENLVKSDYLGVIICNWWRKVQKIGIFGNQNTNTLQIHMKTPKNRDLHHKNTQFKHFQAEYTENLGHSMRVFRKIEKFTIFSRQITSNLTYRVEHSKQSDFSAKRV